MNEKSIALLSQHLLAHLERLVVLREYHREITDPYVKSALVATIDDTQEAIARVASRLRQLGEISPTQLSEEVSEKLLKQSRNRRSLADRIQFIFRGLMHQAEWYTLHTKNFVDDPDSQATLVALAEQIRVRVDRWRSLMQEMKVPPESPV